MLLTELRLRSNCETIRETKSAMITTDDIGEGGHNRVPIGHTGLSVA